VWGAPHGPPPPPPPAPGGPLPVVQPPQQVVRVDLVADRGGRISHPRRRELPVVSGVELGGVEAERRDLGGTPPVVGLRREICRGSFGLDEQFVQLQRRLPPIDPAEDL